MEELYKQSVKTVYGFLYSLCRDPLLAEDLTQEVFLQAIRSIHRYNGQCKFSVWLCQIGRHLWYQHLEKRKREVPMGDDIYAIADSRESGKSAESVVLINEEVRGLLEAISRMQPDVRDTMLLRLLYDLSFKEIGLIIGRSENWSRVTYFRGKEKILREWEEHYEG